MTRGQGAREAGGAGILALVLLLVPVAVRAQTYLVVLTGLSGEPKYADEFRVWAGGLLEAAEQRYGIAREHLTYLADDGRTVAGVTPIKATRAALDSTLGALAPQLEPSALLMFVMFGHGSAAGGADRFNLAGPDLTPGDLAGMLARFPTQQIVVINGASASGDWVAPLAGPRRVIITATRSGQERFETTFAHFFVEGLVDGTADQDKDGRISLLEAFEFARQSVASLYERGNRLSTEHALLEDDGDGRGSLTPAEPGGDGEVARWLFLGDTPRTQAADSLLAPLYARRDSLERAIATLRSAKDTLPPERYQQDLEALLLKLAQVSRAIRESEGREP